MNYETIKLNKTELKICLKYTKNCCIGGYSPIKQSRINGAALLKYNFVGQVGTLAGCIYMFGREEGMREYIKARELADKNPYKGDGGQDIVGKNIDIKCSYMRSSNDPLKYNFLLRPKDIYPDWIYLQTLAIKDSINGELDVHIMGWIKTDDLPKNPESRGPFKGAYKLPITKMRELPIAKI